MKSNAFISKVLCIALCLMSLIFALIDCAYASKEELLNLYEARSGIL